MTNINYFGFMKLRYIVMGFFILIIVFTFSFSLVIDKNAVYADWYVDGNGELIYTPPGGEVLGVVYAKDGEDGGGSSGSGSGSSGGGSSGGSSEEKKEEKKEKREESKSSSSGLSGSSATNSNPIFMFPQSSSTKKEKDKSSIIFPATEQATGGPRIKTEEGKTEIIFGEGEKIKTRTKNGETRTDIYSGGVKVRFEQKDGRMIIKAEREDGGEVILGEQELFKIEERLDKNTIKIATGSGNSFVFARGTVGAKSNFPLSVDLATNALTVNTPNGPKVVIVLPDAAVQNMLAANVINRLGVQTVAGATTAASLKGVGDIVTLGLRNGVPVYEIPGVSDQKLLGFIPVSIPKKVIVSAETGALVTKETSPLNALLDLVSF